MQVFLDSGCGTTLVNKKFLTKLKKKDISKEKWKTKAGSSPMSQMCKVQFVLPQFHKGCEIKATVYINATDAETNQYNMIIGRELLHIFGIDLVFSKGEMSWDNATVPMQSIDILLKESSIDQLKDEIFFSHDTETTDVERIQDIIDIKYALADLG